MASKFSNKFRYRFDAFMARGGLSVFVMLLIVFLFILTLLSLVRGSLIWTFSAEDLPVQHDSDFWGNAYITFLELTAPGNMNQDLYSSGAYKALAIFAGISGVIIFSALIAFITTGLNQKIYKLKRGHSKVIESGHTLILGWNEQRIVEIIRELMIANESERRGCVVILADQDKEMMDDRLRLRIPKTGNTKVVTRSGKISSQTNLHIVSVETCNSAIALADCPENSSPDKKAASDAKVIQTILAVTSILREMPDYDAENEKLNIVAEIFNPTHRTIVQNAFPDSVVTVDIEDIIAKILVQTSRAEGLSQVYNEILSFDGCEMYFHRANWDNITFAELPFRFPDGVPMGIRHADGSLSLNPDINYSLKADDDILILAEDDSTIEFRSRPVAKAADLPLAQRQASRLLEKELILGWTSMSPTIMVQYGKYVLPGSSIEIMLKDPSEKQIQEIEKANAANPNLSITMIRKDKLNMEDLQGLKLADYDNIIILAEGEENGEPQAIDSGNIVALLLIRDIFNRDPNISEHTKLVTEILDSQNSALVSQAGVKDVIISSKLISMILAQVSEEPDIKAVYDEMFEEEGSEVYIKPVDLYFESLPAEVSFADIIRLVQKRGEVCLGLKIKKEESNAGGNFGVKLIPEKNSRFTLESGDAFVVFAEGQL